MLKATCTVVQSHVLQTSLSFDVLDALLMSEACFQVIYRMLFLSLCAVLVYKLYLPLFLTISNLGPCNIHKGMN